MANKIVLISPYGRHEEAEASAAITPGHLVELHTDSTLTAELVRKHNNSLASAERLVAIEDALQGLTIDDAYAAGDKVQLRLCMPGDVALVFLEANANVDIGDSLVSAGDGTLRKQAGTETTSVHEVVVAVAMESSWVETSVRIPVRFL